MQKQNQIHWDEQKIKYAWDNISEREKKLARKEAGLRSHTLDEREEKINRKKRQLRQLRSELRQKETEIIHLHSGYLPNYSWSRDNEYPFPRVIDKCYSSSGED